MLRHDGHNVYILERSSDARESHMAGVCCAWDCLEFLKKYDRIKQPFTLKSERLQAVDQSRSIYKYFKAPRQITSWDVMYWRLRANSDGFASKYYAEPPPKEFLGAGNGVYLASHQVTALKEMKKESYVDLCSGKA